MPVIKARELDYAVSAKQLLSGLSFEIPEQSFTVVVGENGAGKSTLLKLVMGFAKPTGGDLEVLENVPHLDPYRDRNHIAFLSEALSPPIDWSVQEFLDFNRWFYPHYSLERQSQLLQILQLNLKSRIGQLSTGETRRIQIVAGLSYHPRLILIDEFTAVLDIVGRGKFMSILQSMIADKSATVVMATNIIDDVELYATHVLVLHEGHKVSFDSKEGLKSLYPQYLLTQVIANLIDREPMKENAK